MGNSLQELMRRRQKDDFVGRDEELTLFERNLELAPEDPDRRFIFNVFGQGGVGKTTLLKRWHSLAKRHQYLVATVDESAKDVLQTMGQIAGQLQASGYELKAFRDRYRVYRQKRDELEADPNAPTGFAGLAGRTVARIGLHAARRAPGIGLAAEFIPEEAVIEQVGAWTEFVRQRVSNKDERELVLEPVRTLTPLFLNGLSEAADDAPLALFIDTYEETGSFLDDWLFDIFEGRFGPLPTELVLTIAGRKELNRDRWSGYSTFISRVSLEPFTVPEATAYLVKRGVTNESVQKVIIELSARLPILLATLSVDAPESVDEIGEASTVAIVRFLKWVDDPLLRQAALRCALPRRLDRDLVSLLLEENAEKADSVFEWLKGMPFVSDRSDGWQYHEVVRSQMLRHSRRESRDEWIRLNTLLATHHTQRRDALQLNQKLRFKDAEWTNSSLDALYHSLLARPADIGMMLNGFVEALDNRFSFAVDWARVTELAGVTCGSQSLIGWGQDLGRGLSGFDDDSDYQAFLNVLSRILDEKSILLENRGVVFGFQGVTYRRLERYEEALADLTRAIELQPQYKWAIVHRGVTYRQLERYEEALADLTRAIELQPQYEWAIVQRGVTYHLLERYEEALADLTRAIELKPEYERAIVRRGVTYHQLERYEEALADFTRAIELKPEDEWAVVHRGVTYRQLERYEEALADLTRAIELKPEYEWAIAHRGVTYRQLERYEEALADFTRAIELQPEAEWVVIAGRGETYGNIGRYEEALADLTRAIELKPEDEWAVARRGETYRDIGRYEEALADLTRAIELKPEYEWAIAHRGVTYRQLERYEEALADLTRAIELQPQYEWAIVQRGVTYRQLERYEEALADLTRAIKLQPEDEWAIASRGVTYGDMGWNEEALADLTRAIELKPEYEKAIAYRGVAYRQLERYEEALADFTRAIELQPENEWILIAGRGETYGNMGRYEEALADLTRAIELKPEDEWAVARRGETYRDIGRYEEALADLTRAIELKPEYEWAVVQRGVTYRQLERYEEALADLTRAIELKPEYEWAIASRGVTYRAMEWYEEALADLTRAIAIGSARQTPSFSNQIDLAFCYLAAGRFDESAALYEQIFDGSVSISQFREAISNLNEFLQLFPDDGPAQQRLAQLEEQKRLLFPD